MIYIISILKSDSTEIINYKGFDSLSESIILLSPDLMKSIIENTNITVVSTEIKNNDIVLNNWVKKIHTESKEFIDGKITKRHYGTKYLAVATEESSYKLVDFAGNIIYKQKEEMKDLVKQGDVANCKIINSTTGEKLETIDTYRIQQDAEFETLIQNKYNRFTAKTKMLGLGDLTFTYGIENHEVKLTKYTGTAKNVIIPTFITVIMKNAFRSEELATLQLSEGIKVIGSRAFYNGNLEHIEIPASVELVSQEAFGYNNKLFSNNGELNTDRFKLGSNKTLVLEQNI